VKIISPDAYAKQFEDMPYIVAVAAETMNTHGDQGGTGLSREDLIKRAETAISRYPNHAKDVSLVTLAMLADNLIPDESGRVLLREYLARMDDLINKAAWSSQPIQPKRTACAA